MGKKDKKNSEKKMAERAAKKIAKKARKEEVKKVVTKCKKCNKPFSYDPEWGEPELCSECERKKAEENKIAYRGVCKDCGKPYYVKAGVANWLKSKGFEMPKRCYECRSMRKIEKKKAEEEESK